MTVPQMTKVETFAIIVALLIALTGVVMVAVALYAPTYQECRDLKTKPTR